MSRTFRFALVALALLGTTVTFSACMESPTAITEQECCFSNDN